MTLDFHYNRSHCLLIFSFQCYAIPGGVDINFPEISTTFMAELKKRAEADSMAGQLLMEKLPDSFNFFASSENSLGLIELNKNREEINEYIVKVVENGLDESDCKALDTPCIYNLIGKQLFTSKCLFY